MSELKTFRVEVQRKVVQMQTAIVEVRAVDRDGAGCEVMDGFAEDGSDMTWEDGAEDFGDFEITHIETA